MSVMQFMVEIYLYRDDEYGAPGKNAFGWIVDLVNENTGRFLGSLPADLSEDSELHISIMPKCRDVIAYADGLIPEFASAISVRRSGPMKRLSDVRADDGRTVAESMRLICFEVAQPMLDRRKEGKSEDPLQDPAYVLSGVVPRRFEIALSWFPRGPGKSDERRCIRVDLVRGDIKEFLCKIPDDLDDASFVAVTIETHAGKITSFADGKAPAKVTSDAAAPHDFVRLDEIRTDGGLTYADVIRGLGADGLEASE